MARSTTDHQIQEKSPVQLVKKNVKARQRPEFENGGKKFPRKSTKSELNDASGSSGKSPKSNRCATKKTEGRAADECVKKDVNEIRKKQARSGRKGFGFLDKQEKNVKGWENGDASS